MFVKILLSVAVVFVALMAFKNGWFLRESGLVGKCSVYQTASSGAQQERCTSGRIDGRPSLTGKGCVVQSTFGDTQYWLCPAPVNSSPAGV